jgi:hypothetical protein
MLMLLPKINSLQTLSSAAKIQMYLLFLHHLQKGSALISTSILAHGANLEHCMLIPSAKELGERVCKALIGLHCFTGCDSTSAFKGQGKVKALKTMLGNVSYQNIFQEIGKEWEINDISPTIEKFVCELYGKNDMEAVNDVRDQIFKMRFKLDASLPPNRDALVNHAKRANYQAAIHQRSLQQTVGAPSPIGFGWRKDQYDHIVPLWNTMPWAPHSLLKHFTCSCKKTKCMGNSKCSCKEHGLHTRHATTH